uniref:Transposase n=1 Tax=Heterorhabditis bacteriophora TaxID=37862 RepID=A0A1I7WS73_HETBA
MIIVAILEKPLVYLNLSFTRSEQENVVVIVDVVLVTGHRHYAWLIVCDGFSSNNDFKAFVFAVRGVAVLSTTDIKITNFKASKATSSSALGANSFTEYRAY